MSTYYFLVCDDHLERTDAASLAAGGPCHLGDSDKTLLSFIIAHAGCLVRIVREDEDSAFNKNYRDWTAETLHDERRRAAEQGRWEE